MIFKNFWKFYDFLTKCMTLCTLTFALLCLRRELDVLMVSASRFRGQTHALDDRGAFSNRFGNFYFHEKIMIFGNLGKSSNPLEILMKSIDSGSGALSRVGGRCSLLRTRRSPRGGGIGARGAAGVPEARNTPGMLLVLSLLIFMAIGGQ